MQQLSPVEGSAPDPIRSEHRRPRQGLDPLSRLQVATAARLLRTVSPQDGEVEIALHEIARQLERIAEWAESAKGERPAARM
jgi:hypothetical protein